MDINETKIMLQSVVIVNRDNPEHIILVGALDNMLKYVEKIEFENAKLKREKIDKDIFMNKSNL